MLDEIGVLVRQYDYFQILNTVEMINRVKLIMSSDSFRNFLVRSLSTAVIVPISGYIIIVGGNYFSIFISMLGAVMIWEMARAIFGVVQPRFLIILSIGFGLLILLTGLKTGVMLISTFVLLLVASFSTYCLVINQADKITRFLVFSLFIVIPCLLFLWLREAKELIILFWILSCVVATDVGAYLVGKIIGGARLAPKISPNKTWSGLFGGVTASAFTGLGFSVFWMEKHFKFVCLSLLIAIVAQMGDLLESRFKRKYSIKETSNLIPGHGGIMDRLDGHMAAVTFIALISSLTNQISF
ncbi:MAG: phosphatidate cytidylyltransferase [Thalassobaculaceae bacterium]